MSWNGTFKGLDLAKDVNKAAGKATLIAAEVIGEEADSQVPLDEGTLKASKTIEYSETENATYIGYGGGGDSNFPVVPYAVKWHEEEANFQHGRKKNYLRDPVKTKGGKALMVALKQQIGEEL